MAKINFFIKLKNYRRITLLFLVLASIASNELQAKPWKKRTMLEDASLETNQPESELSTSPKSANDSLENESLLTTKQNPTKDVAQSSTTKETILEGVSNDAVPEGEVTFNFQDASLTNLINYMADIKKINLIPSTETNEVKISLNMRETVNQENAWEIFTTLLNVSGFCIVKTGNLYKVVKNDVKSSEPHPLFVGVPAEILPNSSKTIRFVTFLKNTPAAEAENLLKNFLDPKAQIITQPTMNALIITERAENIKYAMAILNKLDESGIKESCQIIRLNKSNAADVKKFLDDLIKKPETSSLARLLGQQSEGSADYFPGNVKLIAEDRTNSLIMLGTPSSLKKLESFITEYFEGNWRTRTPFYPYECQYAECEQIKGILDDIINTEASASKAGNSRGGARYLGNVRIEADKYSNKLIIFSQDSKDLELVKELIADLDKPQPMVALETLIVQVKQLDNKGFGGQLHNKTNNQPIPSVDFQTGNLGGIITRGTGDNITSILGNLMSTVAGSQIGHTVLTVGNGTREDVWAVFRAVKKLDNTNIISNPFLTVANRVKGAFSSGDERRVVAEDGGSGGLKGFTPVKASTDIDFTPQISPDGLISLDINVVISDFTDTSGNNTDRKELKTTVTMSDGQILVLGGFIKTKVNESKNATPFFGSIPLLGWLGKSKQKDVDKSYIFIFVSPTIIKPRRQPGSDLYTKMKLHSASNMSKKTSDTSRSMDPIDNLFFNYKDSGSSHKIIDFANARYQPTTVDLTRDSLYRGKEIDQTPEEILTEVSHEKIMVGQDQITLTSVETKPLDQTMEELSSIHATIPKKKTMQSKVQNNRKPSSIKLATKKQPLQVKNSANKTKKIALEPRPNMSAASKNYVKIDAKTTPVTTTIKTIKLTHLQEDETPAQQTKLTLKPKQSIKLQPKNYVEPEDEKSAPDFEALMAKNNTQHAKEMPKFYVAAREADYTYDEDDAEVFDKLIKKENNSIKIVGKNTEESIDDDAEQGLDEIFALSKIKNKQRKSRLAAFESDFMEQKDRKPTRLTHFSKTLNKDSSSQINDEDSAIDDFDINFAKKKHKRTINNDLEIISHHRPKNLKRTLLIAENESDTTPIKTSRANRFKKLISSKDNLQQDETTESIEL